MSRKIVTHLAILCVIFILIGPTIFIVSLVLSLRLPNPNLDEFNNFASFSGYFLNLASFILLGYLSFLAYQASSKINNFQMSLILDFRVTSSDEWELLNCGSASIRNISIRFRTMDREWSKWVACYTMAGNDILALPWLRYADEIQVIYCDFQVENFFKLSYFDLQVQSIERLSKEDFDRLLFARANSIDLHNLVNFKTNLGSSSSYSPSNFKEYRSTFEFKLFRERVIRHKHDHRKFGRVFTHPSISEVTFVTYDFPVSVRSTDAGPDKTLAWGRMVITDPEHLLLMDEYEEVII